MLTNLNDVKDWESMIDILNDGIYVTNAEGLTLKVNKSYEQITGVPKEHLIGRYMKDIVKEGTLSVSITQKVIATQKEVVIEQEYKNGNQAIVRGVPVFENGEIRMVISFVRDNSVIADIQKELGDSKLLLRHYQEKIKEYAGSPNIVAESEEFKKMILLAHKVANFNSTVLILGESGTGKEVIAKEIHEKSPKASQVFLKINCGAIPENLLEAELFGYESGAYTGAKKNGHMGIFEVAKEGTVFLDEIGDMPLSLQVKLLRVLQEKTIQRIGSSIPIHIDTRIIAATNIDLEEKVKEGKFRKDLYYRLNVISMKLPPLRERQRDIPPLVDYFTKKINEKYEMNKKFSTQIIKQFLDYSWPGNVRELENIIERIMVTYEGDEIVYQKGLLPWRYDFDEMLEKEEYQIMPLKEAREWIERKLLLAATERYATTYEIAEVLGISQPSVSRKLKKIKEISEEKPE